MTKLWQALAAVFAVAAASGAGMIAQSVPVSDDPQVPARDETPVLEALWTRWFVELASAPVADGTNLGMVRAEKAAFRAAAARAGLQYRERYAFDVLWNGLSIEISPLQVSTLSRIDGVKSIYPVATVSVPEPTTPGESTDLAAALAMTGADVAQNTLGLTGAGVRVAVLDSGIDYDHHDLGGCFGPGCRVETGWDFVGDDYDSDSLDPAGRVPHPDPDPDDCNGHGTHVSGIVGANGAIKGVAPGVTFGAYRVFGCDGSSESDIIIAALERALADNMQVVNMSLGSAFDWPQSPEAQASDRLVNKGVSVVASIGNSGASGLYAAGAPGLGQKVIGVASFDNTHFTLPYFTISTDEMKIGYNAADGAPAPPQSGTSPMARTGTATSTADACSGLPAGSLTGKVALIRRGTCSFYLKSRNAQNAGAAGVVLYNNVAGRLIAIVAGTPPISIPVVTISDTEGVAINNRLAAGPVDMTWTNQLASFPNATGNLISSFSSYGLSPDLALKPDIGAPGGFIRSTYPLELGGYATISGTSMSTPHTAGAVALLLEARPHTPSNAVRSILQNSADPHNWWSNPALGLLDNVHRQGAGMLDIPGAIQATTRIEPGKLALGESQAGPATRTLRITNDGSANVTYQLSHVGALATGPNTFTPSFFAAFATASFAVGGLPASSVTVPAGESATVDVTLTAPAAGLANKGLYGGYIVFTPQGGGQIYRVPYAGFKGDYQSIQALAPTPAGLPWLAKLTGGSFIKQTAGTIYTLASGDVPFFLMHLDHQSRRLRLEVFEAISGKAWHRAHDEEYLPRNSAATSFFAFTWDGTTTSGKKTYVVPNGQYVVHLSVLKALGDPANPADWETWNSPAFYIARP